jgi:hypothetical protein
MNQGNSARFQDDDGIRQDGGLLIHFPAQSRWVGVFLAFQSQAWHTDDITGHAVVPPGDSRPEPGGQPVRVVAALVNPRGPAPESENVTLLNASPDPVDLTGWHLADRLGHTSAVPAGQLAPGATLLIPLGNGVQLGNGGGQITLLDADGLKVHGVSYTAQQAAREGWTVVF